MEYDLPEKFDLIVIGTGLPESIIAAAAARIGKTVLHLDTNEFYGGPWASFNLDQLIDFIDGINSKDITKLSDNDFKIEENFSGFLFAEQMWHANESSAENDNNKTVNTEVEECKSNISDDSIIDIKKKVENSSQSDINLKETEWTKEKILSLSRHFNIDLSPKLLYSCGELVKLLISSNICRYAEFRALDHVCAKFNTTQIRIVPCSRSDVFNSKDLTVVEKRLLMKLLNQCMSYEKNTEELNEFKNKTFMEFLKANRLTEKIIYYVSVAISMSNDTTKFEVGMENTLKFLQSLGKYGDTPFLFPMYGCGELPQCFCRLCAVFGGTYCLKKTINKFEFAPESNGKRVVGINLGNQIISSENLVIGSGTLPKKFINSVSQNIGIARGIFITSTPIGDRDINSGGGGVNFSRLSNGDNHALVVMLTQYSACVPKNLYLIHITTQSITGNAKDDLTPFVNQLLELEYPPKIIYSSYFLIPQHENISEIENVFITKSPYFEIDYDKSLEDVKKIFETIYPNELFLPRAPDPEQIVVGDEDPTTPKCEDALGLLTEKLEVLDTEEMALNEESELKQ